MSIQGVTTEKLLAVMTKYYPTPHDLIRFQAITSKYNVEVNLFRFLLFALSRVNQPCFDELCALSPSARSAFRTILPYYPEMDQAGASTEAINNSTSPDNPLFVEELRAPFLAALDNKLSVEGLETKIPTDNPYTTRIRSLLFAIGSMDLMQYIALFTISSEAICNIIRSLISYGEYPKEFRNTPIRTDANVRLAVSDNDLTLWFAAYLASELNPSYLVPLLTQPDFLATINCNTNPSSGAMHLKESTYLQLALATVANQQDYLSRVYTPENLLNTDFNAVLQGTEFSFFGCIVEAASLGMGTSWNNLLTICHATPALCERLNRINLEAKGKSGKTISQLFAEHPQLDEEFNTIKMFVNANASLLTKRASMPALDAQLEKFGQKDHYLSGPKLAEKLHAIWNEPEQHQHEIATVVELIQKIGSAENLPMRHVDPTLECSNLAMLIKIAEAGIASPLETYLNRKDLKCSSLKSLRKCEGVEAALVKLNTSQHYILWEKFQNKCAGKAITPASDLAKESASSQSSPQAVPVNEAADTRPRAKSVMQLMKRFSSTSLTQ